MYYFHINYKETGYRTYSFPRISRPQGMPCPEESIISETKFSYDNSGLYIFENLPTIAEMKQKILASKKSNVPNPNEFYAGIIISSFSQLSKEHFDVLSGVKPEKPKTESESKQNPVVEYPCKQNRNPKECSINLYTKGGCDICFYKKELEPNK